MRAFLLCLLVAGLGQKKTEITFVFEGSALGIKACGYLHAPPVGVPRGTLWFDGAEHAQFRLAGLNPEDYWFGWYAGARWEARTILFHPEEPWVVGSIVWAGDQGVIDILSVDLEHGEIPVSVTIR